MKPLKSYHYETCCVDSDGESINAMCGSFTMREVSYRTMLKHCAGLIQWALDHNYNARKDQGITLKDDWHVSYHRSVYQRVPCYYLVWSGIEFIWTERK